MGKSILIVDDEASVTLTLDGFFRNKGYEVFRAFYGDQALARIEQDRPMLVILDLQMPGMDGIAVLEKIRGTYPEVKVLVITAHSDQYRQDLERLKPEEVRLKPVSLEELTQAVEALLKGARPPDLAKGPAPPKAPAAEEKIRLLFIEGSEEVFLLYLKPYFESPQRKPRYDVAFAPGPEETFPLLEKFRPHLVLLDSTRLAVGVDAGRLATNMSRTPTPPLEVILHAIPSGRGIPTNALRQLEQAVERAAQQHRLLPTCP